MTNFPTVDQRIKATLSQDAGRIPVVIGLCGSGRTSLLQRLHHEFGPGESQYVNVERTATTPERFLAALTAGSPFIETRPLGQISPREAFDATLAFFANARRADHGPVTFLLDEVLEFRTFESFPGLRRALPELLAVIASSPNRFVLTSRYVTRTERALASAPPQFVAIPIGGIADEELRRRLTGRACPAAGGPTAIDDGSAAALAGVVSRLAEGRAAYACAIMDAMAAECTQTPDPVAALASLLETNARVWSLCEFTYELRLHRARGYGALKAILEILAQEEPLTLTEISQRLGRTPGSTKDYLSWLEDVDLVAVQQKRYRFRDPVLRMWVRLHCRPTPPTAEEIGREVQMHAAARLTPAAAAAECRM